MLPLARLRCRLLPLLLVLLARSAAVRAGPPAGSESESTRERLAPVLDGIWLGVRLADAGEGVAVTTVTRHSPAEHAGLREGDRIVRYRVDRRGGGGGDGEWVEATTSDALVDDLRELARRDIVAFEVARDDATLRISAKLAPRFGRVVARVAELVRRNRLLRERAPDEVERLLEFAPYLLDGVDRAPGAWEALNRAVGSLGVSHVAVIPQWSYEAYLGGEASGEGRAQLGLFLSPLEVAGEARLFVRSVMTGSAAHAAGLEPGDEVATIDGVSAATSARIVLAGFESFHARRGIRVEPGETVTLGVRRRAGGPVRDVTLENSTPISGLQSTLASARVVSTEFCPVGYVHLWNLLPASLPDDLRGILRGRLGRARVLVVDLRGRGGSADVTLEVEQVLRADGRAIAALIDDEARSAKEVLAYRLRPLERCVLVGETTAGAVVPAGYADLFGEGKMMVPSRRVLPGILRLTDGVALEGVGVDPEVDVEFDLPYSGGRDVILSRALGVLRELDAARPERVRL